MTSLVLDKPEVVFGIVQPGQVSVPKHVRVELSDSGTIADAFDSSI